MGDSLRVELVNETARSEGDRAWLHVRNHVVNTYNFFPLVAFAAP